MRIFRVIIQVSDISSAEVFYSALLGFLGNRVSPGRHYFNCGGVILACYDPHADGDNFDAKPNPDHVYLSTHEVEKVFERAKKLNVADLSELEVQPWGERSFYLKDPFGNPICFVDEKTLFTGSYVSPALFTGHANFLVVLLEV